MSKTLIWKPTLLVAALAGFLAGKSAEALAATVDVQLTPHQAHYQLDVKELRIPGAAVSQPGEFVVRIQRRCTDWVLLTRLSLTVDVGNGETLQIDSIGTAEEGLDGSTMRFDSEFTMNDRIIESLAGTAQRSDTQAGRAILTAPEQGQAVLPRGVLFPIAAFQRSVEQILQGKKIVNYVLFDGSTPDPIRGTDVVVGAGIPLGDEPQGDTHLLDGNYWRVVTSFHAIDATDAPPLVTNTADVYANGITTRIGLDIGLALTEGVLTQIQELPLPTCP